MTNTILAAPTSAEQRTTEIAAQPRQASPLPTSLRSRIRAALMSRVGPDARQMGLAINVIKSVHTLIFVGMGFCVLYILYSGLTGRVSRLTKVSFTVVSGEALIFFGNGQRCPLSDLAEDLGSAHGTVGDIFLPDWLARRIPQISSTLLAVSLIGLLWHRLSNTRRSSPCTGRNIQKSEGTISAC
jgi:hypothetical protein